MAATERQPTGARPDPAAIRAWWDTLVRPGDVHEARIPKTRRNGPRRLFGVASGYFDDGDAFVRAVGAISGLDAEGVYLTLNPVDPDLLARCANRLQDGRPTTTADADIVRRRHLLIDIDPVRPSGISASDAERALALERRDAVAQALADLGWPPPVATLATGNGGGLLYRLRLDNTPDALALVERTLRGLAATFNDGRVVIDTTTANAARIAKVPGTVAAKGDDLPGRPWRTATADMTGRPLPVPDALLEAIAVSAPEPHAGSGAGTDDIRDRMHAAGLDWTEREKTYGTVFELNRCLTSADHTDGACVIEFASGALAYKCQHNRCAAFGWSDVRERLGYGERAAGPRVTIGGRAPGDEARSAGERGRPTEQSEDDRDAVLEQAFAPPPPNCAYGWFADYAALMAPTSEAPAQFHLATALTLAGAMIGRRAAIEWFGETLYTNLYTVLIGRTGRSRKDTAIKRGLAVPQRPIGTQAPPAPGFDVARDVSSAEGLIQVLRDQPNTLLYLTELTSLLANARRKGTRTIIDRLIEAWDTPEILQNNTKNNPLYATRPYLSILAATQPSRLADNITEEDIHSGFANRWLYVVGTGKTPMARAPEVDWAAAWRLHTDLFAAIGRFNPTTLVRLSPATDALWDEWYLGVLAREGRDDAEDDMRARHANLALKIGLIHAISDQARTIEPHHLEPAIALVEWTWTQVRELMRFWGVGVDQQISQRIVNQIRRHGAMKRRDLQRATSGRRWGPREFAAVFEAMVRNGTIAIDGEGNYGFPAA